MSDLDDVIDRLYGLPTSEFVAARTTAAKDLAGDDAKRVKSLRRPTAAAHAVNTLVRQHRDLVEALADLGARLRQAQTDGDGSAMRELGSERRQGERAALDAVGGVSAAVRGEVEATLRAVALDPEAADAVLAGRLVTALDGSGFGVFEPGPRRERPTAPAPRRDDGAARRALERAVRERDAAESALDRAQDVFERAEQELTAASDRADAAALAVAEAERDLEATT